ncbi:MAG: P1 family peptidase [Bryobacterales bacterium]|nr:P1 family peptidase [Bryobacterales bacterium]
MRDRTFKGLTDVPGILVGHASDYDGITGCTAILCQQGAVAGIDIRGSATGTAEIELLTPAHLTERIHAVTLAGGSAFGLEAASGVRRVLEQNGVGFPAGVALVPLVPAAILFDLGIGKASARPTREMGEAAARAATGGPVIEGSVGAGTGATVGKLLGMKHATKSGLGSSTRMLAGGVVVSALAVVNAFGDVVDPRGATVIAGTRRTETGMEFLDTAAAMEQGAAASGFEHFNTTLVVVATNARLNKVQAAKLAQSGSLGMARAIRPVWTMFDGDLVMALSLGDRPAALDTLGVAAAEAVSAAILRSVRTARPLGGLPAVAVTE